MQAGVTHTGRRLHYDDTQRITSPRLLVQPIWGGEREEQGGEGCKPDLRDRRSPRRDREVTLCLFVHAFKSLVDLILPASHPSSQLTPRGSAARYASAIAGEGDDDDDEGEGEAAPVSNGGDGGPAPEAAEPSLADTAAVPPPPSPPIPLERSAASGVIHEDAATGTALPQPQAHSAVPKDAGNPAGEGGATSVS